MHKNMGTKCQRKRQSLLVRLGLNSQTTCRREKPRDVNSCYFLLVEETYIALKYNLTSRHFIMINQVSYTNTVDSLS